MPQTTIDRLIVNSPYEEPSSYWKYDPHTRMFDLVEGQRRPAGYVIASSAAQQFDDPGRFIEIPLVNHIRPRVHAWRQAGYPGVTGVTRRLLQHWQDEQEYEARRFFFCQLEAIETLIWLTESAPAERTGIEIPGDDGLFQRLCCKMATGAGKTIVMAMLVAWQILNKVAYPQDTRFSKNVLVIAPGLTVKSRLQVLYPSLPGNYYESFRIVPSDLMDKLRRGRVMVRNWHALSWESADQLQRRRSVDKRGVKSDEAYTREVLQEMANASNLVVINDEAHHAWRINPEAEGKYLRSRDLKDSAVEATVWIGGLDRIHHTRGILSCYDFSATPFAPTGGRTAEETLFGWIVSDFGLNDAIESGLVKTPRVVIRDDAGLDAATYRSRLYHLFRDDDVHADLSRRGAEPHDPLPSLVTTAYTLLGFDWRDHARAWQEKGATTPPVMITVCNRTETAARIKYAFDHHNIPIDELCHPDGLLHIDSKVLDQAESSEEPIAEVEEDTGEVEGQGEEEREDGPRKLTKNQQAELLRRQVDTVGRPGEPGAPIQNVISVGMLSEGWDARTVTHIMGLRAFSSQLLCEQVVGRGLRRTDYQVNKDTGWYEPEYVNIFGVPFTFLPHEGGDDTPPPPPRPVRWVQPDPDKRAFQLAWPNILRIEHTLHPRLTLDVDHVPLLDLYAANTPQIAELAPIIAGKPDLTRIEVIELEKLAREFRTQKIIFKVAGEVFQQLQPDWRGDPALLIAQLVHLTEQFIRSDRIQLHPPLFYQDDLRRRLMLVLNMANIINHIAQAIHFENTARLEIVFDPEKPIRTTGDMLPWATSKPCHPSQLSHINLAVFDSAWEATDAFMLDHHPNVAAWVKNDHLGFEIYYIFRGVVHKYRPDFIIKLASGDQIILETKGQVTDQDRAKWRYLDEWIQAVNEHGAFGRWRRAVAAEQGEIRDKLVDTGEE